MHVITQSVMLSNDFKKIIVKTLKFASFELLIIKYSAGGGDGEQCGLGH